MPSRFNRWTYAKERGGLVELPHTRGRDTWFFIPFRRANSGL
ncbi:unnamed protein product, partial [marine sediment metagenome]